MAFSNALIGVIGAVMGFGMSNAMIIMQPIVGWPTKRRGEPMRCPICNKYSPAKGGVLCNGCYEAPLLVSSEIKGVNQMKLTRNNNDACTRTNRTARQEVIA